MKKIIALIPMLVICLIASAVEPQLNGYSYIDPSGRETLDFYSDKVIYYCKGSSISRRGDYSFRSNKSGIPIGNISEKEITIEVYVGTRIVKMKGRLIYNPQTGAPRDLYLNGEQWKKY